jgi:branched-chain amino acid transport system permease protein
VITAFLDITVTGLIMGGIYALIAVGLNLQYGVSRVLNLAHGEFIMLGAMAAYFFYTLFGISPLISLIICAPLVFLIAIGVYKILFERIRKSSKSMVAFEGSSLLAAFGLSFVLQNTAALAFGSTTKAYSYLIQSVTFAGATFAVNRLVALFFAVVFCLAVYFFLSRTRMGKAIRATTQSLDTAQLMGINVYGVLGISFGLGAVLAGLAGVLLSPFSTISPFMGLQYIIIALIVVVLGGLGNILGSLAAGLILGFVGSIVMFIQPGFTLAAYYLVFLIILLVKPTGIFAR